MSSKKIRTDRQYISSNNHKNDLQRFNQLVIEAMKLGRSIGMANPLDKSYYRQPAMAAILGHEFVPVSCGKGIPDAIDPKTGGPAEYKTITLKDNEVSNLFGGKSLKKGFTYSSATRTENVERSLQEDHYYALFSPDGECLIIVKVAREVVHSRLINQHQKHLSSKKKRGDDDTTGTTASTLDCKVEVIFNIDGSPQQGVEVVYVRTQEIDSPLVS